jgi:hypothetical protein
MHSDLVLSQSIARMGSNLFREDGNRADNSWEFLCCLMMVDLHATYSYKIESL